MKHFLLSISFLCTLSFAVLAQTPLLGPSNFVYLGAFRLPGESGGSNWGYSGHAMTYCPTGDQNGPADGFPGSLYGVGHAWDMFVSEFDIPVPVLSVSKNVEELNSAQTLRPFTDIRAGIGRLGVLQEIPRIGMTYLPPHPPQTTPKLYYAWGAHFQEDEQNVPSHMWSELDFSGPAGAWRIAGASLYTVNDYMFEIPASWADAHADGMYLMTGRYRDGGWSGMGPSMYAIAPWRFGNPPADEDTLSALRLLQYSTTFYEDPSDYTMTNYHNSDEWTGGEWLTAGDKSAVVFVGTKGVGDSAWYGNSLGPCLECEERGWWSEAFHGQIIFYDPNQLAAVANGSLQPWEPQPYAVLEIDDILYSVDSANMKYHTGACAFDRNNGLFYMFEPTADDDKSIVHVWRIDPNVSGIETPVPTETKLGELYPNPISTSATLSYTLATEANVSLAVYDLLGREVLRLEDAAHKHRGTHSKTLYAHGIPPGVYYITFRTGAIVQTRMFVKR